MVDAGGGNRIDTVVLTSTVDGGGGGAPGSNGVDPALSPPPGTANLTEPLGDSAVAVLRNDKGVTVFMMIVRQTIVVSRNLLRIFQRDARKVAIMEMSVPYGIQWRCNGLIRGVIVMKLQRNKLCWSELSHIRRRLDAAVR